MDNVADAYRPFDLGPFILASVITAIRVVGHTVKVARTNPIRTLRYE